MMRKSFCIFTVAAGILLSGMTGCANTKEYVDEQIRLLSIKTEELNSEINSLRTDTGVSIGNVRKEVEASQQDIHALQGVMERQREEIYKELNTAQEAMKRARDKLREGKLLYEMTISDESVFFAFGKTGLSKDAASALSMFANVLITENKEIYIEIQGHTDNIGSDAYNLKLGQARAESVMRYLHTRHNIPLHRMNVFSYGESRHVAPNDTAGNRAKNRRVVLMVME